MVGTNNCPCPKTPCQCSNKGVDANLPSESDFSETTSSSTVTTTPLRSLNNVRDELQNAIDLMGTSTPRLTTINTSSEADNEESMLSSMVSSKETEPPSETSGRQTTELTSSITRPFTTYDCSNISKNTEQKTMHIQGQPCCKCIKCTDTEMYMTGYRVSVPVPVQMPSPVERPPPAAPATAGPCMPCPVETKPRCCSKKTQARCTCTEKYGFAPCQQVPRPSRQEMPKKRSFFDWFKEGHRETAPRKQSCQLYKINIEEAEEDGSPPRRLVFDMIDGLPKPVTGNVSTNTDKIRTEHSGINTKRHCFLNYAPCEKSSRYNMKCSKAGPAVNNYKDYYSNDESISKEIHQKKVKCFPANINMAKRRSECKYIDKYGDTRVDFYYFDHGNAQYLHTTDPAPVLYCELLAEKTEQTTTRFWAEIFTTMHIATSFIMSFFLQLFKFLLYSILRPIMVGGIQLLSDYFIKPLLTTLFNGIIQPFMIFLYNIATSLRDLCDPLAEGIGYFCLAIAHVFRAIRLVTVRNKSEPNPYACCQIR